MVRRSDYCTRRPAPRSSSPALPSGVSTRECHYLGRDLLVGRYNNPLVYRVRQEEEGSGNTAYLNGSIITACRPYNNPYDVSRREGSLGL
jgi:hypothetical protein